MKFYTRFKRLAVSSVLTAACATLAPIALAAQLDSDARTAIPKDVQQIIVVDYRAMQNSPAAMDLKARILPPELKQLEQALKSSGFNENHDVEELAFAAYRTGDGDTVKIVGIAQGQFSLTDILATFKKNKVKPTLYRTNRLYPMGQSGMLVAFLNPTTMVFGSNDAIKPALDARDGLAPNLLTNQEMLGQMGGVDYRAALEHSRPEGHAVHDARPARRSLATRRLRAGQEAPARLALHHELPERRQVLTGCRPRPTPSPPRPCRPLLNAAAMYKKVSGTATEKQAVDATTIDSSAGQLQVRFAASDSQFSALLQSPLFQSVVK